MILSPRSGLWTPGHRRPPNVIELYDAAGEAGMAANLARGVSTAPTIVRAGNRYYQNGATFAALADNKHAVEQDAAGRKFIGVYGAATSALGHTSPDGNWLLVEMTDAVSALDSPIADTKWTDVTETSATAAHGYGTTATWHALADGQYASVEWIVKAGNRGLLEFLITNLEYSAAAAAYVTVNTATWEVTHYGASHSSAVYVDHVVRQLSSNTYSVRLIARRVGDAFAASPRIYGATTDNTFTAAESYAGNDAAVAFSVVGGSVVIGAAPYYGPPIVTAGAAATKNAEIITRPVGAYSLPGTWEFVIRTDDTVPTNKRIFAWYDASSDAVIELYLTADGYVYQAVNNGAGATVGQSVAVAVNDGALHRVRASFSTNNCGLWVDGTVVRDVSCAMPAVADLDVYAVGSGEGGNCLDGEIHEAKFTPGVLV
jgi:hypothetical protein